MNYKYRVIAWFNVFLNPYPPTLSIIITGENMEDAINNFYETHDGAEILEIEDYEEAVQI